MTITEFLTLSSAFTVGIIIWASIKTAYSHVRRPKLDDICHCRGCVMARNHVGYQPCSNLDKFGLPMPKRQPPIMPKRQPPIMPKCKPARDVSNDRP